MIDQAIKLFERLGLHDWAGEDGTEDCYHELKAMHSMRYGLFWEHKEFKDLYVPMMQVVLDDMYYVVFKRYSLHERHRDEELTRFGELFKTAPTS